MTAQAPRAVTVLLVAEHSPSVGLGHLHRVLALAAALRHRRIGVNVLTFGPLLPGHALDRRDDVVVETDAETDAARVERIRSVVQVGASGSVVIDVPRIGEAALCRIRELGVRVAVFGEPAAGRIPCDLLVHPSATGGRTAYAGRVAPHTRLLLGLRYAVLRSDVVERRASVPPTADTVQRILVALGGGEISEDLARVMGGLRGVGTSLEIDVVLVPWARQADAMELRRGERDPRVRVHCDGKHPAQLMADADLAVSGGGVTSLELACLGVPTMIVERAPNQRHNAEILAREGAALDLGPVEGLQTGALAPVVSRLEDPAARRSMRRRARAFIDGRGAQRVAQEILQ